MILTRLQELLSELFDVEPEEITSDTDFIEDLGADSLDIVEFLMILEEEFDFEKLDELDLTPYHTVGDVINFIERSGHA